MTKRFQVWNVIAWGTGILLLTGSVYHITGINLQINIPNIDGLWNLVLDVAAGVGGVSGFLLLLVLGFKRKGWRATALPKIHTSPSFVIKKLIINSYSKAFPRPFFDWPNLIVIILSIIVVLIFLISGSSGIVTVTAFYASVLFLNNLLNVDMPRLKVENPGMTKNYLSDIDAPDLGIQNFISDETYPEKEESIILINPINITNIGEEDVKGLKMYYRVYDKNGKEVSDGWRTVSNLESQIKILGKEKNYRADCFIDEVHDDSPPDYYMQYKIIPGSRHYQLTQTRMVEVSDS